jgi:hypothetical protein
MASEWARTLSHSEIETAMTCQARHAFKYTGHLSGGETLKRKAIAAPLSRGRAWGAAVAVWHSTSQSLLGEMEAHAALFESLTADVEEQRERGLPVDPGLVVDEQNLLSAILDHHMSIVPRFSNYSKIEQELNTQIMSRSGRRASNRYRFQAFLDGFTTDDYGHDWLVEEKLRMSRLSSVVDIQRMRQIRRYAWAYQRETGRKVVGVIVEERLCEAPKPPRIVQGGKRGTFAPSHAKDQMCTPEAYVAVCGEYGVEPKAETVQALRNRDWHRQVRVTLSPREIREAGRELVSAAKLIRDLDSGELYPVRNATRQNCNGCDYRDICDHPDDAFTVSMQFERTVPKRLRPPQEVAASAQDGGDSGSGSGFDPPASPSIFQQEAIEA